MNISKIRTAPAAILISLLGLLTAMPGVADQIVADDLIVQGAVNQTGSLCVGVDCVNNEAFNGDTLRLKENNLRIRLHDTTASGDEYSTSWYIVANDSASGGNSLFQFQYTDGNTSTGTPVMTLGTGASGSKGVAIGYGSTLASDVISVGQTDLVRQLKHVATGLADTDLLITKTVNEYSPYAAQHAQIAAANQALDALNAQLDNIETALNDKDQPPSAPVLLSPEDGATGLDPSSVTLSWQSSTDAEDDPLKYTVTYCTDQNFSGCTPVDVPATDAVAMVTTLGGGMGIMFLGFMAPGLREKRMAVTCTVIVLLAIMLAGCGNGGGSSAASGSIPKSVTMTTTINSLSPGTTYYWKVGVTDGIKTTESAARHFTTQ